MEPATEHNRFYHRGKRARYEGLPRHFSDRRVSVRNRRAWLAGWDRQDVLQAMAAEPREIRAERLRAACRQLAKIADFVRKRRKDQ